MLALWAIASDRAGAGSLKPECTGGLIRAGLPALDRRTPDMERPGARAQQYRL